MDGKKESSATVSGEPLLVITRAFDAPRSLLWKAWTEPERLARWWGPKGFTMLRSTLDLRPGGLFHYGMRSPNGREMWGKFVYREIAAPERLVFVVSFSDEKAGTIRAPFAPAWPLEVLNTLSLAERSGKTTLTLTGTPVNASDEERAAFGSMIQSMQQGFAGTFDQLEAYLSSQSSGRQ
jgi:uncharacterized protein YndB with AHSA1/START domain